MNKTQLVKRAIAIGIVGAMVLSDAVPSLAAPVPSSTAIVKTSAPDMIDHVRSRRSQRVGAGIALGVIGALAGAAAVQNQYYYGGPGYYGGPVYYGGPGYYEPGYYGAPGYYGDYRYDPGPEIALGVIGAAAAAIAGAPYRAPRLRRGACWIETDPRGFGYWGQCRR